MSTSPAHSATLLQRIALIALSCMLAFSTFVSALAITELHDHDCIGEDCSICLVLDMAQAMLSAAASPAGSPGASASILFAAAFATAALFLFLRTETPVTRKTKLLI